MMKRIASILMILMLAVTVFPASKAFAVNVEYKETALDKAWDWATTLGKSGTEKDQIIAQHKAERLQKHAEKVAKEAQKEAGAAAQDMKKKLGF